MIGKTKRKNQESPSAIKHPPTGKYKWNLLYMCMVMHYTLLINKCLSHKTEHAYQEENHLFISSDSKMSVCVDSYCIR